jgi:hypothetical protein
MYNTGIRYSGNYRNPANDTVLSGEKGKGKPVSQATLRKSSPLTVAGLNSEGSDASLENFNDASEASSGNAGVKEAKSTVFLNRDIQQTEPGSWHRILQTSYRNSNRASVTLGLAAGVVGGVSGGPGGAMFGMSVGSSLGAHLGAVSGIVQECSKTPSVDETTGAVPEQDIHPSAEENHFAGHVIEVIDHAGHHAAMGSIAVGVTALLTSLATGNPIPIALHAAGVYSGAAWAFGLTTGTTSWVRQHVQRSAEVLQREQQTSPGDIELLPWKEVEKIEEKGKIETEREAIPR